MVVAPKRWWSRVSVVVRARWYDAAGNLLSEDERQSATSVELEEVETGTGYTLQRTYATLDYEEDLDNTSAFLPENSDFTKGSWDLTAVEGDALVPVDTFERLRSLLGEGDLKGELCRMMELPVWDVAPEAVKRGAYDWLRARHATSETKAAPPPHDGAKERLRDDWYDFILRWEARVADVLERFYERQEAVVVARLRGVKTRRGTRHWTPTPPALESKAIDSNVVLPAGKWKAEIEGDLTQTVVHLFEATAAKVGEGVNAGAGPLIALDSPEVQDAVRARVQRLMATTEDRAELVRKVIMDADASEADLDTIVDLVKGTYQQRQIWASGASRNEVTPAVNMAMLLEATKAGLTTKSWLSSRDTKVRFTHTHEGGGDGQDALLFAPFMIGGFPLMHPGDPTGPPQEVRNCRCVMTFTKDANAPTPAAHPYWSWLSEALDRLLNWLGVDPPEDLTPQSLEGRGDVAERLANLIQVHAAQAVNHSPRTPETRGHVLEVARELGLPSSTITELEAALLVREAAA